MIKTLCIASLILLTIGCGAEAKGQKTNTEDMLNIELEVSPQKFAFSEMDHVVVSLSGENLGEKAIIPNFYLYELRINGEKSFAWSLTVGNGLRPQKWFELPPGESVQTNWNTLAKGLFPEPGEYKLELMLGDEVVQFFTVNCIADEAP